MADRALKVVNNQVRVSVSGGALTAALAAQAALPFAERAETAQTAAEAVLAEIAAIELAGSTAPSIAGKADKTVVGINIATIGTPENPANDNTPDYLAAQALLPGGHGDVQFPLGNWYVNIENTESAQGIRGRMGEGETGAGGINCLRPFDTDKPTVTIGGGASAVFNPSIRDIVISGYKGVGDSAPAALKFEGGVAHGSFFNIELIGGDITLDIEPSGGGAVTCNYFDHVHIRNSEAGSGKRAMKMVRPADDEGYFTHNVFSHGHVNGPPDGYALEIADLDGPGIVPVFTNWYFDLTPDAGVKMIGNAFIYAFDLLLDPGTLGAVILKSDQLTLDPTRYWGGLVRHGGQVIENSVGATQAIPGDCDWFFFKPTISEMFFRGHMYWAGTGDRYDTTKYLDLYTSTSLGVNGLDLTVRNATPSTSLTTGAIQTEGGFACKGDVHLGAVCNHYNGAGSLRMTQEASGAGWRVDVAQAGGNYRITPGAGGYLVVAGAGIYASADNAQALGLDGNAFSNIVGKQFSVDSFPVIDTNRLHRLRSYTVATLPAGVAGATAFVSDATTPTFLGALTGGGAVSTPVFYNGSAWLAA